MTDTQPELILGRYHLGDQLAMGGTARVHRARDRQLDRDVAVKLLHPHLLPDDTSRRRLEAEARAASSLSHPGIATVYDVQTDPEAPAIVMELVDGEPLSARLSRGPMDPRDVARLGADVADALFHAHRRGIVHRDVKPGNILLERGSGRARLVDFGIAHSLASGTESLTQTGTALGTPRYMAPEQMAGGRIGPRTDLWSLGVVLYQALSGRVPFDGPTPLAIADQQRAGASPIAGVDSALASVVARCLAYDIADRPLDARDLADTLRAWLVGNSDTVAMRRAVHPSVSPSAAILLPREARSGQPAGGQSRRPGPLAVAATGAAVVLLVALAVPALLSGRGGGAAAPAGKATAEPTAQPTQGRLAELRTAFLAACGERASSDFDQESRVELEKKINEEIAKCLEKAEKDAEGDGGGPPPKDDGRGNGNEGNEGHGNGGHGGGRGKGD